MLISEKYNTSIRNMYEESKKIAETIKKEYSALSVKVTGYEREVKRLEKIVRESRNRVKCENQPLKELSCKEDVTYEEIENILAPYLHLGTNLETLTRTKQLLEEIRQDRLNKRSELRKAEHEKAWLEALLYQ